MFGFALYKVRGRSMEPTLNEGDIVLLKRTEPKSGKIVVVNHADFGRIIKRLDDKGHLSGDNPQSTPTKQLGLLKDSQLIGVARLVITPDGLKRL